MAFKYKAGKVKTVWLPVTASTAITRGTLVTFASGLLVAATSSTTPVLTEGVLDKTIATTDADYATSARLVPVMVPLEKEVVWEADVTSGLVSTDIGAEWDLTDGANVNRTASLVKIVKPVQVLSTTKGLFYVKINGSY